MDISIRFKTGRLLVLKGSGARVQDGVLEVITFNPKTNKARIGQTFKADTISWARSQHGTYYVGDAEMAAHD